MTSVATHTSLEEIKDIREFLRKEDNDTILRLCACATHAVIGIVIVMLHKLILNCHCNFIEELISNFRGWALEDFKDCSLWYFGSTRLFSTPFSLIFFLYQFYEFYFKGKSRLPYGSTKLFSTLFFWV